MKSIWRYSVIILVLTTMMVIYPVFAEEIHYPGEIVDTKIEVAENPEEAVMAELFLYYDTNAFELIPSNKVQGNRLVDLDIMGLQPGRAIPVSFLIKQDAAPGSYCIDPVANWAYDINEQSVNGLLYSSIMINVGNKNETEDQDIIIPEGLQWQIVDEDHVVITGYEGRASSVIIPRIINGIPVTGIGAFAFLNHDEITEIQLPETVEIIGDWAFTGTSLVEMKIPNSVLEIIGAPFYNCSRLKSFSIAADHPAFRVENHALIRNADNCLLAYPSAMDRSFYNVPESVRLINQLAFSQANLKMVTIPGSVEYIGEYAFEASTIESLTILNGVKEIGSYSFYYCYQLTDVSLPKSIQTIGNNPFLGCSQLRNIEVDANNLEFRSEGGLLIRNSDNCLICWALDGTEESLHIPETVSAIADESLSAPWGVESITIPYSVMSIYGNPFSWCIRLTQFVIPSGHLFLCTDNNALVEKRSGMLIAFPVGLVENGMTNVVISSNVRGIAENAFEGCYGIKELTIPSNVISIEPWALNHFSEEVIVHVEQGSAAEAYCEEYGVNYDYM